MKIKKDTHYDDPFYIQNHHPISTTKTFRTFENGSVSPPLKINATKRTKHYSVYKYHKSRETIPDALYIKQQTFIYTKIRIMRKIKISNGFSFKYSKLPLQFHQKIFNKKKFHQSHCQIIVRLLMFEMLKKLNPVINKLITKIPSILVY